jgi:hypothetical protein
VIVPAVAVHVTAVLDVPFTTAVNCWVPPVGKLMMDGLIITDTTGGAGPGVGVGVGTGAVVVIVSVATSDLLESAWLVAVTVKVPGELGAVYIPDAVIVPPLAVQLTAVLLA